jgi:hypothetical protein
MEPPRAKSPPSEVTPEFAVMETCAKTVPESRDATPNVAEDPTRQNTLQGFAPPVSMTVEPTEVTKVEPIWKYHASVGEPVPARVNIPVICAEVVYL